MSYKVLIPTAGTGSRLGNTTKYINKALVSIGNKPAISRIIDMFPADAEFVVPIGYKGDLIKEFFSLAYPDRKVFFSVVDPYEGPGSGLGYSILCCEQYLQEPFVFCSCDTLVREQIPAPDHNWMAYGEREDLSQYRTLDVINGRVKEILEKGTGRSTSKPYIGLAGIYDHTAFWKYMHEGDETAVLQGESYGLRELLHDGTITAYGLTWMDTGVPEELKQTKEFFHKKNDPNILEKANEAIWFIDGNVIKFSDNTRFISDRVKRGKILDNYVPSINGSSEHMYRYPMAEGEVLSKSITLPIFEKLLNISRDFWKPAELNPEQKAEFQKNCMEFYKTKTYERVSLFYKNFNKSDGTESINGIQMPTLREILDSIDWDWVACGNAGRFHGDYHFENILYDEKRDQFVFLDWRQNFGSSLEVGDIYYDLGKLLHGLIVCHELISLDEYEIEWNVDSIHFDLRRKWILTECEDFFMKWVSQNGYDAKKVRLMTALIFLNIAALHHYPYGLMLYALGKTMLWEVSEL